MAQNPNAAPHFASIMDEAPTEVNRPKPMPPGSYVCVVKDYERDKSKRNQTPFTRFQLTPIAALDDVDPQSLQEAGGLDGKALRIDFWETPDAIFRLDEFHAHCGLDLSEPLARKFRNDEIKNAQVIAYVEHRIDPNDSTRIYTDVKSTAPVE
jgi:hypothetical protein